MGARRTFDFVFADVYEGCGRSCIRLEVVHHFGDFSEAKVCLCRAVVGYGEMQLQM